MGITVRFVDPADPESFRRATDDRTRAYYAETLSNPKLTVFPIGEVAAIGRGLGVPLIMDNTAAPLICRPFDHGAAIVVHSTTKYIGGHGTSIGGMIVDGGNFDWAAHAVRFSTLNEPDPSYHGAIWTEAVKPLGPIAYIIRAEWCSAARHGYVYEPVQCFPIHPGPGNFAPQDTRALPQCRMPSHTICNAILPSHGSSIQVYTKIPSSAAAPTSISGAMAVSSARSSSMAARLERVSSMR